jgi:hypothetical protein
MAKAKLIEQMAVEEGLKRLRAKYSSKEEDVKKPVKRVRMVEEEKKPRVRLTEKPYKDLIPGTPDWMACWREYPKLQKEMVEYQKEYIKERQKVLERRKRLGGKTEEEIIRENAKKEKEKRDKEIADYVAEHGVQKRRSSGQGQYVVEDDDDDDEEEYQDVDDDNDEDEEETVKPKKTKKEVKTVKEAKKTVKPEKSHKREVMRTVNKPFGAEGRTFDLYAVSIPDSVKSLPQLKAWLMKEKRTIIEFKDGELKAYEPYRATESGRKAKACIKKQGSRHLVTYRSNKNSALVEDEE